MFHQHLGEMGRPEVPKRKQDKRNEVGSSERPTKGRGYVLIIFSQSLISAYHIVETQ